MADNLDKTLLKPADKPRKNITAAFKNNDQLKTNPALKMKAEKIEFKVI